MRMTNKTRRMALAGLMAALLCIVGPVTLPIGPVPFSMALWVVFLVGGLLPPLPAMASVAVYVALGAVGLPVFSGFQGGLPVLVGPTGGYIWGYFAIAGLLALGQKRGFAARLALALAGLLACYLLGTLWFMQVTGNSFWQSVLLCVAPFILPDVAKAAAALVLSGFLQKRMAKTAHT